MKNLYREQGVRGGEELPRRYYLDDYYADDYRNLPATRAQLRRRWWLFVISGLAFLSAPGILRLAAGSTALEALQTVLAVCGLVGGYVAFSRAIDPFLPRAHERKNFFTEKLAADTEAFFTRLENDAIETRVFLRPATPEELPAEAPAPETKVTAA
jgi:hypothetical protein